MVLQSSAPGINLDPLSVATSTGLGPECREYWDEHGTSWRSLIELHLAIVNRLAAASSWHAP